MAPKIRKSQLEKNKDFFRSIYNCKGKGGVERIKAILESAPVYKLRLLLRLIVTVLDKYIPCKHRLHRIKIKDFTNYLKPLVEKFSEYLKKTRPKLLQFFCAVLPIIRFFIVPLFEVDIPDGVGEDIFEEPQLEQEINGEEGCEDIECDYNFEEEQENTHLKEEEHNEEGGAEEEDHQGPRSVQSIQQELMHEHCKRAKLE